MSTSSPIGGPHPPQQPQPGQPQQAQQVAPQHGQPLQPQGVHAPQQYPQQQFAQQQYPQQQFAQQQYPQQQFAQQQYAQQQPQPLLPPARRNSLATTALVFAAVSTVVMSFVTPLVMQWFFRGYSGSFGPMTRLFIDWGPFMMALPFLLPALGIGISALRPNQPARGKGRAYAAVGIAGFQMAGLVLSVFAAGLNRGFFY